MYTEVTVSNIVGGVPATRLKIRVNETAPVALWDTLPVHKTKEKDVLMVLLLLSNRSITIMSDNQAKVPLLTNAMSLMVTAWATRTNALTAPPKPLGICTWVSGALGVPVVAR